MRKPKQIAIIGLGYVGLPLAVEFGKQYPTIGFDVKPARVAALQAGNDETGEVSPEELAAARHLEFTTDAARLAEADVYVVAVPTPIDRHRQPDLGPLIGASELVGAAIAPGDVVIYESTVYPGATEEDCLPVVERVSGLVFNRDFFAGYSPERINPGDKDRPITKIVKVTSGSTPETAEFVDALYRSIIPAGTHLAPSIKVAEASKIIENTQRDVNIALINELSIIFTHLGIDTTEVIEAAGTK
jgi:UDP-N-acetyl-D-galactosamine dehydrogenase